jgi:hypothetical protein
MAKIALTPDLFVNKPVHWMKDVGPVVFAGNFAFCCEYEAAEDPIDVWVWIYEKPPSLPENPEALLPKTRPLAKRSFLDDDSVLHIRNFILKFVRDADYRKEFLIPA